METCDNCGRELRFDGVIRRITCCNIVYRNRLPTRKELQKQTKAWNKVADKFAKQFKDEEQAN